MGSSVSRPTGRTSFSVISANASAALRWRSTLSEKESVVNAARGESRKKSVVVRSVALGRAEQDEMSIHVRKAGVPRLRARTTYFPGTGGDLPRPPARSPTTTVRMLTSGSGLNMVVRIGAKLGNCQVQHLGTATHSRTRSNWRRHPCQRPVFVRTSGEEGRPD